jgi:hypothetical protein
MNKSDQLKEDCRQLIERSRTLHDRIEQEYASSVEQTVQFAQLDQRCRAARAEAQRLLRRIPTGWLLPTRDGDEPGSVAAHEPVLVDWCIQSSAMARKEARQPSRLVTRVEAERYLVQLHTCWMVSYDAMIAIKRSDRRWLMREHIIAAIGPVAQAHRQLAQFTVTRPLLAVHRAALVLLQSIMDAMDAIAAGHGTVAVRDMREQLTIFQTEIVLFAARAGFISDQ